MSCASGVVLFLVASSFLFHISLAEAFSTDRVGSFSSLPLSVDVIYSILPIQLTRHSRLSCIQSATQASSRSPSRLPFLCELYWLFCAPTSLTEKFVLKNAGAEPWCPKC